MAKLYVFGIGGTGSRVIKALTMLLASGVTMPNTEEIVPIIIDPDEANGDLLRTKEILRKYQDIRGKLSFEKNDFFKTKITQLQSTGTAGSKDSFANNYGFNLLGVQGQTFQDFISYTGLSKENKNLINLLFSNDTLVDKMDVGFKGNPNVGSVVLNQFPNLKEFKHFASTFDQNDRIFIISSIFGGTGAAGFPLLLKNIRMPDESLDNYAFLKNAVIGAVTVHPYFGVAPGKNNKIKKATFYTKTKAALKYYQKNISENNSINALYYIGDQVTAEYENNVGAEDQENYAHFVELASALSIFDFMDNKKLKTEQVNDKPKAINPEYKEYGLKEDTEKINFTHLGAKTSELIKRNLTQYMLFLNYLKNHKDEALKNESQWTIVGDIKLNKSFFDDTFYSDKIDKFNVFFRQWLVEMSKNKRSFSPFNFEVDSKNVFKIVNGIDEKKDTYFTKYKNYNLFDNRLSTSADKVGDMPVEQKFISIFFTATNELINEKLNF